MDTTYKNPNANFFPQPSSTTISNEALANPAPLTLPNAPQDTTNYAGITASIPTFEQIQSQINQTSQAETTADDLMQRILGTSAQVGQKAQRTLQAEQQAGLPQFQTQLGDINSQLQALQKEALAIPLQLQEQATGRGVTAGGLAPIQTGQLRQNAIKSLTLSAIGQTLQGNIANAQATAQRAVDLEFAPLEAELNTLKTAYEMNKDRLTRQDKKRADTLNLQIAERTRLLDEQKADKKTVLGFVAEASKNGAPAVLVQRASEMNNPSEALAMLSQYMVDPMVKQQALADLAFKRAQTAKVYSDMALSKEELALKYKAQAGTNVIDPVTGKPTSELKLTARDSAKALLDKVISGTGTSAVGTSRIFGTQYIPGTRGSDFTVQFDNLKSLLSLDNIKLLKGQGQVSDAERKLLSDASAKISLSQSEKEFKSALQEVYVGLGGTQEVTLTDKSGNSQKVLIDANGLNQAKADGLTITY